MADKDSGSKVSIVRIVQVLLRESDKENPLSQQEILRYLDEKYGMVISRKSIGRNLVRLREAGLPVKCREVSRMVNGKETSLSLDWYWDHVLSQEDLQALIDLLYFSHRPAQQVKQLTDKLKKLQICSFEDGKGCVKNIPMSFRNTDYTLLLQQLTQGIKGKKQIRFHYDHYEADGKRHHNVSPSGEEKWYQMSPYQLISSDERYYILGNQEGLESISAFSLDLMSDVEILDIPLRLQKELQGQAKEERYIDFFRPCQAMYTGSQEICRFEADWHLISDIVLDFGKTACLVSASQDKVTVEVTMQPKALKAWALQKAPHVRILSPSYLVREVKEAAQDLARLYGAL